MGPTAQDFYAAFGLGEDERHISTVDADGVALAAIQGLYAQNQALGGGERRPALAAGRPGGASTCGGGRRGESLKSQRGPSTN